VRVVWCMAALSFAGSLILFVYATDWGRWIYIHVVSIAVLLLYLDGLRRAGRSPESPATGRRRVLVCALLFFYATLWTLPHVPMQTPRFGYVGLVQYAFAYRQHHPLP